MIAKWLLGIFFPFICYAESVSFYEGYLLYKNHLQYGKNANSLDIKEVLAGMEAAYKGLELSQDEIRSKQKMLYEQIKEQRLADAIKFLAALESQNDVIEIVKGKLYYKPIHKGEGPRVQENDAPILLYKSKSIQNGKEVDIHTLDEPKTIYLKSAILGFIQGVVGMQEKEKRIIYIHPELAYGSASELIEPNSLMIFEVEIVKTHDPKFSAKE